MTKNPQVDRRTDPRRIPDAARRQDGVFTAAQARREGWTDRQIRRRRETGAWRTAVGRGLTGSAQPSHRQRCVAVALTWPDRVISHVSAAHVRDWPITVGPLVHVTAPKRLRPSPGLRVHQATLTRSDVTRVHGFQHVTSVQRTALDCLATLPLERALDLFAWLTTRNVFQRTDLAAGVRARTGRRGTGQLVRLLRITRHGAVSGGEFRLQRLLRRARIRGWRANARVRLPGGAVAVADILFAQARLIVEFDGRRAHEGPAAFVRDRRRQNALQCHGYLVLRYIWADLVERPGEVIHEIRTVLAARLAA